MLELILTAINAKLAMLNKLANLYCLAERRPIDGGKTVPYAYRGGRDLQPINIDSGSVGYWRINGEGSDEYINDPYVAGQQRQVTWPLRFYAMAHRDSQFTASALADLIGSTITDADDDVAQMLDMEDVSITVSGRDLDTTALYGSEFDELDLSYHLAFIALTVTVTIRGAASCFPDPCGIDTDILHSFNFCDAATRARLTDEQVDCLTAALCETPPTLCEQLAEVLPADVVADVFDCLTPEAQAELLDSECVIPPCADATAVLKNTANTTISTTSIASGASQNITAPDATAVLKNTANTTLLTEAIPSNVSENITAPDATITLNGAAYGSAPSGTTFNVVATAPSLSLSTTTSTPAYGASFTITATPSGFTPTSYTWLANGNQIGTGTPLVWTVNLLGSVVITCIATDGSNTAIGTTTLTSTYTRVTSIYTDGVNDFVRGNWKIGAAKGRALSVSFWVKYVSGTAFFIRIGEPVDGQNYTFLVQPSSTGPALNFRIGAGSGYHIASQAVTANVWYHVVMTYRCAGYSTANPIAIYVNGTSVYSTTSTSNHTQVVKPSIQLGVPEGFGGAASVKFHGLSIYEDCISAAQAATLYNGGTPLSVPTLTGVTMSEYFGGMEVAQVPSTNTSAAWTEVVGVNGGVINCNNNFASPYGLVADIP